MTATSAENETLAHYAEPAIQLDGRAGVLELDGVFRRRPALACVVVHTEHGPKVVDRSWFEAWVTGRLGYGRAVHSRTRLQDIAFPESLVLGADTTVEAAALAIIDGQGRVIANNIGVSGPQNAISTVRTTAVIAGLYQRYAFQAVHDPLTGLHNRMFLTEHLRRHGSAAVPAALYIDLDRFKDVNDRFGHAAGDQVLVEFARRLQALAGPGDLVIRLGGDEFVVLLAGGHDPALTRASAERVVAEAARPFVISVEQVGVTVQLGASVGVASAGRARHCAVAPDQLLTEADMAMYQAKSMGRGRLFHYDEQILAEREAPATTHARHDLERRLRQALAEQALELHYQPLLELGSGRVGAVEALARWHDPVLGPVTPGEFIAVAEESGLIVDLGRWALAQACHDAAGWAAGPSVAVNVSAVQLAQRSFITDVTDALAGSGLPPSRLCLEITETAAIADLCETARRLNELRAMGVTVALDDFGTGHSSLTMLRRLPVSVVKIDKSFTGRITDDAADATLVRLVTDAAHVLGMTVCAEGIETAEQAAQLAAMGCDLVQGWLIAPAQPGPQALAAWLRRHDAGEGHPQPAPLPLGASDELVLVADSEGRLSYVGGASLSVLGRRAEEMLGTSVLAMIHPDDLDRIRAKGLPAHDRNGTTYRFRARDGSYRWLLCRTRRVASGSEGRWQLMLACRDVTRSAEAEQALADLRSHLHTIGVDEELSRTAWVPVIPASRSRRATNDHR
ncbi:EAL domain-containing protein [Kineosporia babensis]|uniref:EAL domain-containing protein n=1 Tax=Kineosporia babensis TaxID=499548 RepID=A0A9X1SVH6_9ACTN|nr:EAL domain-containing protein [Kineosporia babensis]MCD5312850.1 EAL domain-containing protein [Kineosporia babensis]